MIEGRACRRWRFVKMGLSHVISLVGGLEPWNFMTFHILGMSSSQLTFIFVRELKPPTSSQFGPFMTILSVCLSASNINQHL